MSWVIILLWVILRLPAFQLFEAEETHGDVWAVIWWGVDETGFGHLQKRIKTEKKNKELHLIFND